MPEVVYTMPIFAEGNMSRFQKFWSTFKTPGKVASNDWDNELDDLSIFYEEQQKRYCRPESLEAIVERTRFTKQEVQALYRGFKESCPSASISREKSKEHFGHIFPYGADSNYADYVFDTFDLDGNGVINFEEFVVTLSTITRGSADDKFEWIFCLYDLDRTGFITKPNVYRLVKSIYLLLGNLTSPPLQAVVIEEHTEMIWNKLIAGIPGDRVNKEEFIQKCRNDDEIISSLHVLEVVI